MMFLLSKVLCSFLFFSAASFTFFIFVIVVTDSYFFNPDEIGVSFIKMITWNNNVTLLNGGRSGFLVASLKHHLVDVFQICEPFLGSSGLRIFSHCMFYFTPTLVLMYSYGSIFHKPLKAGKRCQLSRCSRERKISFGESSEKMTFKRSWTSRSVLWLDGPLKVSGIFVATQPTSRILGLRNGSRDENRAQKFRLGKGISLRCRRVPHGVRQLQLHCQQQQKRGPRATAALQ